MTCLESLVGLDDCTLSTAPYTLNQIGYSKEQLLDLMDDSYSTVEDFLTANSKTAAAMIAADVLTMMPPGMSTSSVLENKTIGTYPTTRASFTGSGFVGVRQQIHNTADFVSVRISKIRLFTNHSGDIDVLIYNVNEGSLVDTVTVTAVAGSMITVDCDVQIDSNLQDLNIWIGYDTTGIDAYRSQIFGSGCCGNNYSLTSNWCNFYTSTIEAPFTLNQLTSAEYAPGITFDYAIECNNNQFVCSVKSQLGLAMLYKTALCIQEYAKGFGQFSNQQTINQAGNEDRLQWAMDQYNQYMKGLMNTLRFPQNHCFRCNPNVSVQNRLPG